MDWGRVYDWELLVANAAGLGLTLVFLPPGETSVAVGPVSVDPSYPLFVLFGATAAWSALGLWRSNPGDDSDPA
jgi:hypothetical protein